MELRLARFLEYSHRSISSSFRTPLPIFSNEHVSHIVRLHYYQIGTNVLSSNMIRPLTRLAVLTDNQLQFLQVIFLCTDFDEVNWAEVQRISGQASVTSCKKKQCDLFKKVGNLAFADEDEESIAQPVRSAGIKGAPREAHAEEDEEPRLSTPMAAPVKKLVQKDPAGNKQAPVRRSRRVAGKKVTEEGWNMERCFSSLSVDH